MFSWRYVIKRVIYLIPILIGISLMTFTISRILPGDPVAAIAGGPYARPKQVETLTRKYGLDKPLPQQYFIYMRGLLQGDLGMSMRYRHAVIEDIKRFGPATAELAIVAFIVMCLTGITLGVLSAVNRGKIVDHLSRLVSLVAVAAPAMWVGLMLQLIFYRHLGWFPYGRRIDINIGPPKSITNLYIVDSLLTGNLPALTSSLHHIILPAFVLALGGTAYLARMQRASMLEVISKEYVKVARAKGLSEKAVILRHIFRNALLPVITLLGLSLGSLLGGSFVVEIIFAWPGLGLYVTESILYLDFNPIMAVVLIMAVLYVFLNLIVDLTYSFLDPRIRDQG